MGIGGSLFLIALGAILAFAVTAHITGVDINTVGVILMIVGLVGFALSLVFLMSRRRTDVIRRGPDGVGSTTYITPNDPIDGQY
jgi:Flp pilus assembly protein TadB